MTKQDYLTKPIALLGVEVTPLTITDLNHLVEKIISSGNKEIIGNHNLHSVYLYHHDDKMRSFYKQACAVHIDGMPLILWGKVMGYKLNHIHRVTYVDWIGSLMMLSEAKNWRVYYLGGKPGVAQMASEILRQSFTNLSIRTHHGYFNLDESNGVLRSIKDFNPNILMVGMGMPKQEHWIVDNFSNISANVILNAGACFDYVAGVVPLPPRWMGKMGLEWLYRLVKEPRRLGRRYIIEPWFLIPWFYRDLKMKWLMCNN